MMMRRVLLLGLAGLCWTRASAARTTSEVRYTKAQSYSTALRLLRIDLGYKVTERDPEAAYLLFEFPNDKQTSFGSIEIVNTQDAVKLSVRLPQLPSYRENMLRDELLKKLHQDYGDPPAQKPKSDEDEKQKDGEHERDGSDDEKRPKREGKQKKPSEFD